MNRLLEPLYRKIMQQLRACDLIRTNDGAKIQTIQVETLEGEIIEVPRLQDYGITSVPLKGAKGVVAAIGGRSNGYVALKVDDGEYRLFGLKPGEVALYDNQGQTVYLKENGQMQIKAVTHVDVEAPTVHFTGNVVIDGELTVDGIDFTPHTHPGDSGGNTGAPN